MLPNAQLRSPQPPLQPLAPAQAAPVELARAELAWAVAALDCAEQSGQPQELCLALLAVARSYHRLQAFSAAESQLRKALHWAREGGLQALALDLLCEMGELACDDAEWRQHNGQCGRAAQDRARDAAFEATRRLGLMQTAGREARCAAELAGELPRVLPRVLPRLCKVLLRCGDAEDAAALEQRLLQTAES